MDGEAESVLYRVSVCGGVVVVVSGEVCLKR